MSDPELESIVRALQYGSIGGSNSISHRIDPDPGDYGRIIVPAQGPQPCHVLFVGEAPGYHEMQDLQPFSVNGKSGKELTRMLERICLPRTTVRITNLALTQPPERNGKQLPPSREEIERDSPRLILELLATRPRWIGAVGRYAARWLTGLALDMESAHGFCFPLGARVHRLLRSVGDRSDCGGGQTRGESACMATEVPYGAGEEDPRRQRVRSGRSTQVSRPDRWLDQVIVVPLYHPAAGMHNANVARFVWLDMQQFGKYVRGDLEPINPVDQHPEPIYEDIRNKEQLNQLVETALDSGGGCVGVDTEGVPSDPVSIQVSGVDGTGFQIDAAETDHLRALFDLFRLHRKLKLVGHGWLHDIHVVGVLDPEHFTGIDWSRVEDTMLMSFCLGTLPIGLKPLSRRVSGAEQKSYSETIAPAERRMSLRYIEEAIEARKCGACGGTGKSLQSRTVIDAGCPHCDGTGRVPGARKNTTKNCKCVKKVDTCLDFKCVDGALWPRRKGQLKYDWSTGQWKISSGWEIGRYLRRLKVDIEKGVFDSPDEVDGDGNGGNVDGGAGDDSEEIDAVTGERKSKTVRQRWQSWDEDVREPVEALLGPMPTPTLRDVDPAVRRRYACRDADLTRRNYPALREMLREAGLEEAYRLDLDVIPVAAEMERSGMAVDVAKLELLSERLHRENDIILRRLHQVARRPINPASGDQVAGLLFGERRLSYNLEEQRELQPELSFYLQSEKMTKTRKREATDDKVLEGLKLKYAGRDEVVEVVQLILDYRMRHKIITTYAEKIPRIARRKSRTGEWRVYTRIRPTTAATFRWASGDPINLQNIPIRNKGGADLGRAVRECFVAPEGMTLLSADYSQVELRVLAAKSGDDGLLRAFREGIDPHLLGASRAWKMSYEDMAERYRSGDQKVADIRDSAKNLNFGIVFGITPRGLQAQMELRGLRYTLDDCADLIRMWIKDVFPGIGEYIQEVHEFGGIHGYARSELGHMRHCPGVWSAIPSIKEEAFRQLVNFTIQCTAAEILKAGLRDLWRGGKRHLDAIGARLLMSVHDENLLELPRTEAAMDTAKLVVESFMANPLPLPNGVQITSKVKFAGNWGALKAA